MFGSTEGNDCWRPDFFKKMFDFGIHANLLEFTDQRPSPDHLPIYEAKMIWHFSHRSSTYEGVSPAERNNGQARDVTDAELDDPDFEIMPRCWTTKAAFQERVAGRNWTQGWVLSMRDVTNATNERSTIFALRPFLPSNDKLPSTFVDRPAPEVAALTANLSLDYVARQKIGCTNLASFIVEQFPILPPPSAPPSGSPSSLPGCWS